MTTNKFYVIGGQYEAFCYGAQPVAVAHYNDGDRVVWEEV